MKDTLLPSQVLGNQKWYVIDAKNQTLGRLSTRVASLLIGKNKTSYTQFLSVGDSIIIINAAQINVSGKKEKQKLYKRHSGRPGGLKSESLESLRDRKPERILECSIRGMLPKGPLGRQMYTKLKVYAGDTHPHQAQTPELLNL